MTKSNRWNGFKGIEDDASGDTKKTAPIESSC
jgi:hypothetical protein